MVPDIKENCKKRLGFWNKMSAEILKLDYVQPSLEEGKESVDYLFLAICVINAQLSRETISKDIVIGFLREFLTYAFGIEDCDECIEFKNMERHINEIPTSEIEILRISEVLGE